MPYAAVRKGQLIVAHAPTGPLPSLVPSPKLEVRVNGQLVNTPLPISKDDHISIRGSEVEIPGKWQISLAKGGVQAVINLQPRAIHKYELADVPPSRTLHLRAKCEEILFPPLTLSELLEELSRLGIEHGVDWNQCREITTKPITGEVVIAEGSPPTAAIDGYVELFCLTEPRYITTLGDAERINFRERFNINSVAKGAVLARKHPPVPGSAGISVKGEPVLPEPPNDVFLKLGRGVVLQNETDVVAIEAGRPIIRERGRFVYIAVEPVLIHAGNVDLMSGNLRFSGHIRVLGDVQEGMLVDANEDVVVQGLLSAATVQAGGSACIWGNACSSTIIAGGPLAVVGDFLTVLDALVDELHRLINYTRQLRDRGALHSATRAVQLLVQYKCQMIPELVNEFEQMVARLPSHLNTQALKEFSEHLASALGSCFCRVATLEELETLLEKCIEWQSAISQANAVKGDAQVNILLNSSLTATGNATVLGESHHSYVRAGGDVTVHGSFRGGEIHADGNVLVKELGTPVGTFTKVQAAASSRVRVGYLHENVSITIGKKTYLSRQTGADVHLRYDAEEDQIVKIYAPVRV